MLAGRRPTQSVLEPEEPPARIFTPRHLGLVLPREDSHPAQERQATGHFAACVDPYRAVDDLNVADYHHCAHDFVEREHCEELLAQIGLGQPTATVLLRYVREHAGSVAGLEALPNTLDDRGHAVCQP